MDTGVAMSEQTDVGLRPGQVTMLVVILDVDPDRGVVLSVHKRIRQFAGGWLSITLPATHYDLCLRHAKELIAKVGRDPDIFEATYYLYVVISDTVDATLDTV